MTVSWLMDGNLSAVHSQLPKLDCLQMHQVLICFSLQISRALLTSVMVYPSRQSPHSPSALSILPQENRRENWKKKKVKIVS